MVYDMFCFFNELDLLEFRLRLLDRVVDKFVICESNLTFSGNKKDYIFYQNKDRFERWKDKIVYFPIEQNKDNFSFREVDKYTPDNGPFMIEYEQRNSLLYAKDLLKPEDLVLIGDLDEIPDPKVIEQLKKDYDFSKGNPISLNMLFHYYYMNCQVFGYDRYWNGTVACSAESFSNNTPQYFRDNRNNFYKVGGAGWHFSYLGGIEKIKTKIQSFAHTEFNRPEIVSDENISSAISEGRDVFNRPGVSYSYVYVDQYPEYLKDLMLQYPQFIKWY